jgi:ribosomal protein L35
MKKSVTKRIRITRTGKVMRRRMGVDHFKARKSKRSNREGRNGATLNSKDMKNIANEYVR